MEARYLTDLEWRICHAVNIYVFRNGRDGEQPVLVHIPPAKKKNMRSVLAVIQDRVKYPVGYAKFLFKMDGTRIKDPCELEMYNNYVVASNFDKHFKCAAYGRKRSPLLVLNRDSKHVRVLKLQNQNYYEWLLKKKVVGEERPPYIYPAYYTNENYRAQDLPLGNMGNYQPPEVHARGCCYPRVEGLKGNKTYRLSGGGDSHYRVNTVAVDAAKNMSKMMMDATSTGKRTSGFGKEKQQKRPGQRVGGKLMLEQTPSDMLNANIVNISTETSQEGIAMKTSNAEVPAKFGIEREQVPPQLQLRKMKVPVQIQASTSDEYHEKHADTTCSTQSLEDVRKKSKWGKKSKRKKKSKVVPSMEISLPMLPLPPPEFRDLNNNFSGIEFSQPYMVAQYSGRNHELHRQNVFMGYTPSCQRAFYYCPEKLADINPAGSFHQFGLTFTNPLQQTHPFGQFQFNN